MTWNRGAWVLGMLTVACSSLREGPLDGGPVPADQTAAEEREPVLPGDASSDRPVALDATVARDATVAADWANVSDAEEPVDRPLPMDAPGPLDASLSDDGAPAGDTGADALQADARPTDAPPPTLAVGIYDYASVPSGSLRSQAVAAAWHPSGAYALILAETDKVFRYTPSDGVVSEVASLGPSIFWTALAFTPDGERAALTAVAFASPIGRLFRWNHADASVRSGANTANDQYLAVRYPAEGSQGVLIGQSVSAVTAWAMNLDGTRGALLAARSGLGFGAGCAALAWVTDGFGDPAVAVGCTSQLGILAVTELSGTAQVNELVPIRQTGPVRGMAARPQGDLALAVGGSDGRLYRYYRGAWAADAVSAPAVPGASAVAFSDDGSRALIFGGSGDLWEYRFNQYAAAALTRFRLPLSDPPYSQPSDARATAVAWRPGCDGGIIVGGSIQSSGHPSAFIARFSVRNGRPCPP